MQKVFSGLVGGPAIDGAAQTRAISILFFGSGFAALLYQLVWQRALFRVLGVDIEAVTIVVAAFMVGLGLGSLFGGALSRQLRHRGIILLAIIEFATCLYGLFSLEIFDLLGARVAGASSLTVAAYAFLLVIVPTLLMGASLPILASHVSRIYGLTGRSVGTLYYSNTVGAAFACLTAAIFIFPFMGMQASIRLAAAINATVAVFAYMLSAIPVQSAPLPKRNLASEIQDRVTPSIAFVLAFIGGFVALSYQIYLVRLVNVTTGGLAASFATVLGASLCGLAGGSRAAADFADQPYVRQVSRVVRNLSIACFLGGWLLPILSVDIPGWLLKILLVLTAYVVARCFGCLLPFLAQSTIPVDDETGRKLGWLYLANIFGAAIGGVLTGFIVFDVLPAAMAAQFLALLCISATLLFMEASRGKQTTRWAVVGIIMSLSGAWNTPALSQRLWHTLLFHAPDVKTQEPVAVIENRIGVLAVTRSGNIFGNGLYEGSSSTELLDSKSHVLPPYALTLFHPRPRQVVMIGLSSGAWARVIANNTAVENLTIIEPNPGVIELFRLRPEGMDLLRNPKVNLVVDDGRRWLANTPRRFDAIVQTPITTYREHASIVLSYEFMSLAISRLASGGIFMLASSPSPRVQRTACAVDFKGYRIANAMVIAREPIAFSVPRWSQNLQNYSLDATSPINLEDEEGHKRFEELMLMAGDLGSPRKEDSMLESCETILRRTQGVNGITDDNMGAEWRSPLGLDP